MPAPAPAAEPRTDPGATLIGQLLLQRGHVTEADLERALAFQAQQPGERLGAVLVRLGAVSEENLLAALCAQTGYAAVALADIPRAGVDSALARLGWSGQQLQALRAALWEDEFGALHACAEDPLHSALQEAVESAAAARCNGISSARATRSGCSPAWPTPVRLPASTPRAFARWPRTAR